MALSWQQFGRTSLQLYAEWLLRKAGRRCETQALLDRPPRAFASIKPQTRRVPRRALGFTPPVVARNAAPQVSLTAEDDPDTTAAKAEAQLASVTIVMSLQPLLKPRIVFADAFQFKAPAVTS